MWITSDIIGKISLNVSFFLYLMVYVPQILHNRQKKNLADLSIWLHVFLFSSYFFDLFYGFASHLPWQYKTVSIVGLCLVSIQHLQLTHLYWQQKNQRYWVGLSLVWLVYLVLTSAFFVFRPKDALVVFLMGVAARGCGFVYCIPQIIKNRKTGASHAISVYYLYINLTLTFLDTLSAWLLNWGWPNRIASPLSMGLMLIMIYQAYSANRANDAKWEHSFQVEPPVCRG